MKTSAPEFKALITILRSVGPVISTQRLHRSAGRAATDQVASRIYRVSGKNSKQFPFVQSPAALRPALQQFCPAAAEAVLQLRHELERSGTEDLVKPFVNGSP